MKRFFLTLIALLMFAAFDAAALPKTQAKQVTVDPSGLTHSTNTTAQLVLEDLDEKISASATTTTPGVVRLSTPAEVNAGTSTVSVITPADLSIRFVNTNDYLKSSSGFQKLPSGIIFEWGTSAINQTTAVGTVTLPCSLATTNYAVTATAHGTDAGGYETGGAMMTVISRSTNSFQVKLWSSYTSTSYSTARTFSWNVFGY